MANAVDKVIIRLHSQYYQWDLSEIASFAKALGVDYAVDDVLEQVTFEKPKNQRLIDMANEKGIKSIPAYSLV